MSYSERWWWLIPGGKLATPFVPFCFADRCTISAFHTPFEPNTLSQSACATLVERNAQSTIGGNATRSRATFVERNALSYQNMFVSCHWLGAMMNCDVVSCYILREKLNWDRWCVGLTPPWFRCRPTLVERNGNGCLIPSPAWRTVSFSLGAYQAKCIVGIAEDRNRHRRPSVKSGSRLTNTVV